QLIRGIDQERVGHRGAPRGRRTRRPDGQRSQSGQKQRTACPPHGRGRTGRLSAVAVPLAGGGGAGAPPPTSIGLATAAIPVDVGVGGGGGAVELPVPARSNLLQLEVAQLLDGHDLLLHCMSPRKETRGEG